MPIQRPFHFGEHANETYIDECIGDNKGFLDLGPCADLSGLKTGKINTEGIEFLIETREQKNCVVVGHHNSRKDNVAVEVSLPFHGKKSRGFSFLHTCRMEEPDYKYRIIGQYIFEYEDSSKQSINIVINWNIRDIRSAETLRHNPWTFIRLPDELLGSDRAWTGQSVLQQRLNLQAIQWENSFSQKP